MKSIKIAILIILLYPTLFSCKTKEDKTIKEITQILEKYTFRYVDDRWNVHFITFSGNMATYKMKQLDLTPGLEGGYDRINNQKVPYKIVVEKNGEIYIEFSPQEGTKDIYEYVKRDSGEILLEGKHTLHAIQDDDVESKTPSKEEMKNSDIKENSPKKAEADSAW